MRWSSQQVLADRVGPDAVLPGMRGLLRTVRAPEFAGMVFHEVEARSALNKVPGGSLPFSWTINPYRGCGHACTYCLAGDTRVLLADGRTRALARLRVGEEIYGTRGRGRQRRYVRATVLARWSTVKPAYRIVLADGTRLVASGEHRFLTTRGWRHVTGGEHRRRGLGWAPRPHLALGDTLCGVSQLGPEAVADSDSYRRGYLHGLARAGVGSGGSRGAESSPVPRAVVGAEPARGRSASGASRGGTRADVSGPAPGAAAGEAAYRDAWPSGLGELSWPDEEPTMPDDGWRRGFLAAVFEVAGEYPANGDAWFVHRDPRLIGRVTDALRRLGFAVTREDRRGARLAGGRGARLRFRHAVDPALSTKRGLVGERVDDAAGRLVVEAIEPLGVALPMFDITTSSGDFLAEGVVSHNCFARNSHTYLDFDAGEDFNRQVVVKVNVARVLERELRSPRWRREHVAMGTNTDPYQRAEGRYRLMPEVISALARSGTPLSILTKGTLLAKDLPLLASVSADVSVGLGVSIALLDRELQTSLEPGTPSPAARLELVRRIREAGLACRVMVAPVLPLLTDSTEALDALLGHIASAGATGATVLALHLRPGTREWFLAWLAAHHPALLEPYQRLYARGAYLDRRYRVALAERVAPLLRRHGLDSPAVEGGAGELERGVPADASAQPPRTLSGLPGAQGATGTTAGPGGGGGTTRNSAESRGRYPAAGGEQLALL